MADLTPAAYQAKWNQRFRDNDQFEIDEADFRENVADQLRTFAPLAAASGKTLQELVLPQPVIGGQWYAWPTGLFEARSSFNAQAAPASGSNWRVVLAFSSYTDEQARAANAAALLAVRNRIEVVESKTAPVTLSGGGAPVGYNSVAEAMATIQPNTFSVLTINGGVATGTIDINGGREIQVEVVAGYLSATGNNPLFNVSNGRLNIGKGLYVANAGAFLGAIRVEAGGIVTTSGSPEFRGQNGTCLVNDGGLIQFDGRLRTGGLPTVIHRSGTTILKGFVEAENNIYRAGVILYSAGKLQVLADVQVLPGGTPAQQATVTAGVVMDAPTGDDYLVIGGRVKGRNNAAVVGDGVLTLLGNGQLIGGSSGVVIAGSADGGEPYEAQTLANASYNDLLVTVTEARLFRPSILVNASGFKAQVLKATDNSTWGPERTTGEDMSADLEAAFSDSSKPPVVLIRVQAVRIDAARNAFFRFYLD